jgi:hypothetical protein
MNSVWEVLGSKILTGSPAIPMSLSSFNDFLHLKLGHGSFHPRHYSLAASFLTLISLIKCVVKQ